MKYCGKHPLKDILQQEKKWVYLRAILGTFGYTCLLFGVKYCPIFIVQIIFNTGPFWASIMGYCINGEKVGWVGVCCIFGCFCGVVILVTSRPELNV